MGLVAAITFDFGTTAPACVTLEDPNSSYYGMQFFASAGRTKGRTQALSSAAAFGYYWMYTLPTALSEFYLQAAVKFPWQVVSDFGIIRWRSGTTTLGGVKITTKKTLDVYTGDFASKVITGTTRIPVGVWVVVELRVKIDDSAGALELRINLTSEGSYSGDTKPGADTTVDKIYLGNIPTNNIEYSDVIIHNTTGSVNNSWPNGARPYRLRPTADGFVKEWTPSTGTDHYALVDEDLPVSTDYLRSSTAGDNEELALADLPAAADSVKGAIIVSQAYKGSTSSPNQLKHGLKLSSTDYWQSAKSLDLTMAAVRDILNEHPASGAFSVSDINNAQLLLESV